MAFLPLMSAKFQFLFLQVHLPSHYYYYYYYYKHKSHRKLILRITFRGETMNDLRSPARRYKDSLREYFKIYNKCESLHPESIDYKTC